MTSPFTTPIDLDDAAFAIDARGVSKSFGTKQILHRVDLQVTRGEVVVLVGPSGAGKTTMLRTLNQLETIDEGEISIGGSLLGVRRRQDGRLAPMTARQLAAQRSAIGFVFQHFNLFPHMTVLQNITHSPIHVKGESPAEIGRASCRERV